MDLHGLGQSLLVAAVALARRVAAFGAVGGGDERLWSESTFLREGAGWGGGGFRGQGTSAGPNALDSIYLHVALKCV